MPASAAAGDLISLLDRARSIISTLPDDRVRELEQRVADLESDRDCLSKELGTAEKQIAKLQNLYVATYQIHSTLEPRAVKEAIGEVASNLLGAERFALLIWKPDTSSCEVALGQGLEDDPEGLFSGGVYQGGDEVIDATLADGVIRVGGNGAVAAVPLTVGGKVLGALVVLALLEHRPPLGEDDRELLDLIAAHAASALLAAGVHARTQRKLQSMQGVLRMLAK